MPTNKACKFETCEKMAHAKGLCRGHYNQQNKGQELRPLQAPKKAGKYAHSMIAAGKFMLVSCATSTTHKQERGLN